MLVIYDKETTSFDNLGLGVLRDFKSEPLITEVLNGLYNLEFDYVRDGWLSESLVEENLIKANGQLFRIWNIKKSIDETKITILAKHIFFDLEKSNFLENVAPTDKTAENALSWILDHAAIPTNFKVNGDCTKIASARYVRMNPIEAIYNADNCILSRFGGEIELDNYNVTVHNKRGNDLGLEIRQRKNLNGADYQLDLSTIATRIMPIGRDGLLLPEKYIDSPLINNYFSPFYYKFDVDVGVDEEKGITLENCYQEMRNAVQNLYDSGIDKPKISIAIDFVELSKTVEYKHYSNLETAHLGDSCRVFIPSLNLNLTTRIVKIIYNCSKDRITSMELGTPIPNYVTSTADAEKNLKNAISTDSPTGLLQQAKKNATAMLKHPFTGYMYISEETGEFYLMDTKDINTAQSVWKFGLGGIGYSSTGINGEYQVAITQDGQIVADFITTGTLAAARIEGYNQLVINVASVTNTLNNLIKTVESHKFVEIEDAFESNSVYLSFHGNMYYVYPSDNLYNDFHITDSYLVIEHDEEINKIKLPYFVLNYTDDVYDEFVIDNSMAYIVRRLDSNKQVLVEEIIEELGTIIVPLKSGKNKIYMESFTLDYILKYNVQNNLTKCFATKAELKITEDRINGEVIQKADDKEIKGLIKLQATEFNVELSKKVGNNEVIAKINLSNEKALIQANKINIVGVLTAINNDKTTTIDGNKITTGTISTEQLSANSITTDKIVSEAITADKIRSNSITSKQVSSEIITTTTFQAQKINADNITSGTISTDRLSSDVITTNTFSAQEINADKITAGTISSDRLDANVITTTNFSAQKVNASNISSGTLHIKNGSTYYLKMGFNTKHPEVSGLNVTGNGGLALNGNSISGCTQIGVNIIGTYNSGVVHVNTALYADSTLYYMGWDNNYHELAGLYSWFQSGKTDYVDVRDADGSTKLRLNFTNGLYIGYSKL